MKEEVRKTISKPLTLSYVVILAQVVLIIYLLGVYRNQLPIIYEGLQIWSVYNHLSGFVYGPTSILVGVSLIVGYFTSILYILSGDFQIFEGDPNRTDLLSLSFNIVSPLNSVLIPFYIYVATEDVFFTIMGVIIIILFTLGILPNILPKLFEFIYKLPRGNFIKYLLGPRRVYIIIAVVLSSVAILSFRSPALYELIGVLLIVKIVNKLKSRVRRYMKERVQNYRFNLWLHSQEQSLVDISWEDRIGEEYRKEEFENRITELQNRLTVVLRDIIRKAVPILALMPLILLAFFASLNTSVVILLYVLSSVPVLLMVLKMVTDTPSLYDIYTDNGEINNVFLLEENYEKGFIEILDETGQRRLFTDKIVDMKRRDNADISKKTRYDID